MGNKVGDRIKQLREEVGMKQGKLAEILQRDYGFITPRTTVSRWENGWQEPEVSKMKAMAQIFDVSLDYIAGITDDRNGKAKHEPHIATSDPGYNPFFDENNDAYGEDWDWRKMHGTIDERPVLEAIVRKGMDWSDEKLQKLLSVMDIIG